MSHPHVPPVNFPAPRLADIAPFHVMELLKRAHALEAAGHDIVHMEVGEPDFATPPAVVAAAQAAIAAGQVFYTPALGLPALRAAIAGFYQTRYGVQVPAERIVVTAGASGALMLALACLVSPGSEWLLTDPGYPCNRHFVRSFEGVPVSLPVHAEQRFQPSPAQVAAQWTPRTAGALFASPSNPTGTLLALDELRALAEVVQARGGQLIIDEIYHGLTYGSDAPTALTVSDDIFIVQSFSKYFNMTGWRLGWLVVPERFVRDVEKLAQNLFICPSAPAQHAALAAFTPETLALLETRRAEFGRRRDYLAPALERLGFRLACKPEGAFYLYTDCSALAADSAVLAARLLEEAGVAATPGLDFGSHAPRQHLRFAYTTGMERLEEGVARLARWLGKA